VKRAPAELLVDRYQLTMADSYLAQAIDGDPVAFELYVRALPRNRGYLVAAGLEQALDYLEELSFSDDALAYLEREGIVSPALCDHLRSLRFDGSVYAVPEGTIVHAGEPLVRVEGARLVCQLVESFLLTTVNFQTLIATKASRLVAAAEGRPVVDFGFRRGHGAEAGVAAARAAYIGGCDGTATVAAGYLYGIPTVGTMAHSYVLGFASELAAFCAFLRDHPDETTLLVDTYDPIAGTEHAVEAARRTGVRPRAVRIDLGEAALELAPAMRAILDEGGLTDARITCSGDLNEHQIAALVAAGVPVDGFGVGTDLVTSADAPALGGVYKLVESAGQPVMKRAGAKSTLPGRHQVFREDGADTVALADERLPGRPLLEEVMADGRRHGPPPPLALARERCRHELDALSPAARALHSPFPVQPSLSPRLTALKETFDART
jgi:nicotinate phosphoribosyltransferase